MLCQVLTYLSRKQCSSWAGPAHGPWPGTPMGLGWAEFLRNEWALDGPGLEF